MDIKFANFAKSIVADVGGIGSGDTTVNVDSGDGDALFPTITGSEYFYCVLVDASGNREVVKVTARSGDAFTIVRAQDGTTARVFAQNDKIQLRFNSGAIDDMVTGIISDVESYVDSRMIETGTCIAAFGQSSAPTGWTRKSDWQDNAMLCYSASVSPTSGGSVNPQSSHTHTGPSHSHHMLEYIYSSPSYRLRARNSGGTVVNVMSEYSFAGIDTSGIKPFIIESGTGNGDDFYTANGGTGNTGSNTAPYFQEVIAATKDA